MTSQQTHSITALFQTEAAAQEAIEDLIDEGISEDSIRFLPGYENDGELKPAPGEVHTGFWQALADFFIPNEDRYTYAEGLARGGYMVIVSNLPEPLYARALDILDDDGAVDLEQQEEGWRQAGWTGFQGSDYAGDAALATGTESERIDDDETIPVVEEQIRVGKRDVSHGRVRVRSYVVERPVEEQVDLREENVRIERRPVDRPLTSADAAFEDRTIELEERAEEAVVEKTARVVEEVGLSKERTTRQETISDSVKRTEVEVEDERGVTSRTGTDKV